MNSMSQDQRKGQDAKSDNDGCEDQRLGNGVGKGAGHDGLALGNDGRARPRQPTTREDQEIRAIAQQAETNDQLSKTAAQNQVETGPIQCARGDGKQ